jgi:hypothetical protein
MGQIADDVACGFQCSECGICFDGEHGYPVLCHDCYDSYTDEVGKKPGLPRATIAEL